MHLNPSVSYVDVRFRVVPEYIFSAYCEKPKYFNLGIKDR